MYKLILHFGWGSVYATKNRQPNGEQMTFDTREEAERFGATIRVPYEAVRL